MSSGRSLDEGRGERRNDRGDILSTEEEMTGANISTPRSV